MEEYVKEIAVGLEVNRGLKMLMLGSIGRIGTKSV